MAQADADVASRFRLAILSTGKFLRGVRRPSEYCNNVLELSGIKTVIRNVLSGLVQEHVFLMINNYFDNEPPFQLEDVLLSGSFSEGTLKCNLKEEKLSDMDLMLVLKNIQVRKADQKKGNLPVRENTPFVNLYLTDPDLLKTWSEFLETSSDAACEGAKLSSQKLKSRFRENYTKNVPFAGPVNDEDVDLVGDGPSIAVCSKSPWDENVQDVPKSLKNFCKSDVDFVLAVKCDGWPLCAQEWIFRPRCWPSQDLVETIVKEGFHVVCKSSPKGDFRLSYSTAETLLVGNLGDLQYKTYRAFKSFVGHYKKNWSPIAKKAICSYHLKTIVLWYCERSDPIDWTEDRIVVHLLSLIDDLILAINEKNLPMYFMPKYNMMERLEGTAEAVKQMTELRLNINLIAEAIFYEEPNMPNALDFLNDLLSEEAYQTISSSLEGKTWAPSDFRDMLFKSTKITV